MSDSSPSDQAYSPEIEEYLEPLRDALAERYRMGEKIGEGGMGGVRAATDATIRRDVAMKRLHRPDGVSPEDVHRFLTEARITGQLEHPGIVPVHELGFDTNGHLYYTMKLVHGDSLAGVLSTLRGGERVDEFPLARLLSIFLKVCDTIAYAHAHGVVHRDLKPENIMVGDFGEVLVLDWGIAKILRRKGLGNQVHATVEGMPSPLESFQTMAGQVMGTPAYMPPEQATGRVRDVDETSDVYSLGAILYHILTLYPPIEGESLEEMLFKVARGEVASPLEPRPGWKSGEAGLPHCPGGRIPPHLATIAMKAMSNAQEDRYPNVRELAAAVQVYLDGHTAAPTANRSQNRLLLAIVLVALLAVIVSIGAMLRSRSQLTEALGHLHELQAAPAEPPN